MLLFSVTLDHYNTFTIMPRAPNTTIHLISQQYARELFLDRIWDLLTDNKPSKAEIEASNWNLLIWPKGSCVFIQCWHGPHGYAQIQVRLGPRKYPSFYIHQIILFAFTGQRSLYVLYLNSEFLSILSYS